jgi:hypothetical protein
MSGIINGRAEGNFLVWVAKMEKAPVVAGAFLDI